MYSRAVILLLLCWMVNSFLIITLPKSQRMRPRPRSYFHTIYTQRDDGNTACDDSDDVPPLDMKVLQRRIQQIQDAEDQTSRALTTGLSYRIEELKASEQIQKRLDWSGEEQQQEQQQQQQRQPAPCLPVVCFDALLPGQQLKGSTDDPTFCRLLRDLGLGGLFVMTSLDMNTRKVRRHGVVTKIEAVDSFRDTKKQKEGGPNDYFISAPTAVDFSLIALQRCRVLGPSNGMTARIGRWRRAYDPNGEELRLGWGEERFLDHPMGFEVSQNTTTIGPSGSELSDEEWSMNEVDCRLDVPTTDENVSEAIIVKAESLLPMIEEWYTLASNSKTYENTNVTVMTRIARGQPGLYVNPWKLLQRVRAQLGERPPPSQPTKLAFWAAALINPLPPLGASLEIRGFMLEAPNVRDRLRVLAEGLLRSIQNLKGERPL